jgi:hypothetical protein
MISDPEQNVGQFFATNETWSGGATTKLSGGTSRDACASTSDQLHEMNFLLKKQRLDG